MGSVRRDLLIMVTLDLSFSEKPLTCTFPTLVTEGKEKIYLCNIQPISDTRTSVYNLLTRIIYLIPQNPKKVSPNASYQML